MLQSGGNHKKDKTEKDSPGRFSFSSVESVPSPTPTRMPSSFKRKRPLFGTPTSSNSQTNKHTLTSVPEEKERSPIFNMAASEEQQNTGTTNHDHSMVLNSPDAGMGLTKRRENDDGDEERSIWRDSRRKFERRAPSDKNEYSTSSMNFLISVFLAGPEVGLRPERERHDKEKAVGSTSPLSMPINGSKPLTNNSAIAYFVNPKLWKTANNIGGEEMLLESRTLALSLTPPMNKKLREKFLTRYTDGPNTALEIPSQDGSNFDLNQDWLECPSAMNSPIYNSIYRLGIGRTS